MKRKGWYLVGYDITRPVRRARIFRMLKGEGLAAQKSLFFVKGTEPQLNNLLDRITTLMDLCEDDLRAYPIVHPRDIWTNGPNPLANLPILQFGMEEKQRKSKPRKRKHLTGWKHLVNLRKLRGKNTREEA